MSSNGNNDNMDQRILSAALNLFAYEGYHAVSVPRIAEAAKVGVGSIYRVTDSKSTLAARVFEYAIADLNQALLLRPVRKEAVSPEAFFWMHWEQFAAWIRSSPECFRFVVLYTIAGPGRYQTRLDDIAPLRRILETAKQNDWLFTDDYALVINLIVGPLAMLVLSGDKDTLLNEHALHVTGKAVLRSLMQ